MTMNKIVSALIISAAFAAIGSYVTAGRHVCRIVVTDATGNVWIAGEGDTQLDAWKGAQMPPAWQSIAFPGCYR